MIDGAPLRGRGQGDAIRRQEKRLLAVSACLTIIDLTPARLEEPLIRRREKFHFCFPPLWAQSEPRFALPCNLSALNRRRGKEYQSDFVSRGWPCHWLGEPKGGARRMLFPRKTSSSLHAPPPPFRPQPAWGEEKKTRKNLDSAHFVSIHHARKKFQSTNRQAWLSCLGLLIPLSMKTVFEAKGRLIPPRARWLIMAY